LKESPHIIRASQFKVWRVGLRSFQRIGSFIKPSTRMIQAFGHLASKAIIDINGADLNKLIAGEFLPVKMELENGYVILSLRGVIPGLGLLIDGTVRTQIPKKEVRLSMI